MAIANFIRRSSRSALLRALALALVLAAALLALTGSGPQRGAGPMERSAFRGGAGYWLLAKDGGVFAFGDAKYYGPNRNQGNDIAGMAATATGNGYWTVDDDGDVFAYGDAVDYGSRPGPEIDDITGFAARSQGDGYWMVGKDGAVSAFGAAGYFGGANTLRLSKPIVGMAATPSGKGYWLIAADGGVFSYGDAGFFGSTGAIRLNKPIVDFGPSPDGKGYRFIGNDGGVFSYGNAGFFGSTGAMKLNQPIVGFAATGSGNGYWLVGQDGGVFAFGDAVFYGSTGNLTLRAPIVAIVATPRIKVAPTARNDTATTAEDQPVTIDAEANDTHLLPAAVSVDTNPSHGAATVSGTKLVYTPAANYNGTDSFTYKLTDTVGHSATATVSVTITPVNDAPVASSKSVSTVEETPVSGSVTATDVENDAVTYSVVTSPGHGSLTFNPDGTFTFNPATNFAGSDSFTFRASDTKANSNIATVTLTVTPVNDAPVATAGSASTNEDTTLNGSLSARVTDVDGDTLSFTKVAGPSHGSATVNLDGTYGYTPASNYSGSDSFTFKASDGQVETATVALTITVNAVNDPPVATPDSGTVAEDAVTPLSGQLAGTDVENDPLTFHKATDPAHGTLTVNSDGTFTYSPSANFNGSDSFTFAANDGTNDSTPATFTVTVTPVNDAPVATAGSASTNEDTVLNSTLAARVTDVDGDTLSFTKVAGPSHGTATVSSDGSYSYTPALNYFGSDSFTFKANDGHVDTATVALTITVNSVNDAPVATPASDSTAEDTPLSGQLTGTDVESGALTLTFTKVTDPAHGSLAVNPDGSFIYLPSLNFNGSDSFTFKANDGTADSAPATFSITVLAVNDAPVATAGSASTNEDTLLSASLSARVSDVDGDTLSFVKVTDPLHGVLVLNANGTYTYMPASNYNGSDSFTFKANDGTVNSNIVAITITVNAVNDAPVATAASDSVTEDPVAPLSGLLAGTDVESDPLTFAKVADPGHGSVTVNSNGTFTYSPTANYNGPDSFTFKANDGTADSAPATFSITVTPVNDAPVATAGSASTNEDIVLNGTLSARASDVDGDSLSFSKVAGPAHGTATVNADGSFTYTPALNYNGPDSFTFKANDGAADSNIVALTITVNAVNDAPVAQNGSATVPLLLPVVNGSVTATDVDGDTLTYSLVTGPTNASVFVFNGDGTFTYTSTLLVPGTDSFTFKANDGLADSNVGTFTITVANDDPPIANDDITTVVGVTAIVNVVSNDSDPDNDPLTVTADVSFTAHGTVACLPAGTCTYTLTDGSFHGSDSFTYTLSDPLKLTDTATVTVTVL